MKVFSQYLTDHRQDENASIDVLNTFAELWKDDLTDELKRARDLFSVGQNNLLSRGLDNNFSDLMRKGLSSPELIAHLDSQYKSLLLFMTTSAREYNRDHLFEKPGNFYPFKPKVNGVGFMGYLVMGEREYWPLYPRRARSEQGHPDAQDEEKMQSHRDTVAASLGQLTWLNDVLPQMEAESHASLNHKKFHAEEYWFCVYSSDLIATIEQNAHRFERDHALEDDFYFSQLVSEPRIEFISSTNCCDEGTCREYLKALRLYLNANHLYIPIVVYTHRPYYNGDRYRSIYVITSTGDYRDTQLLWSKPLRLMPLPSPLNPVERSYLHYTQYGRAMLPNLLHSTPLGIVFASLLVLKNDPIDEGYTTWSCKFLIDLVALQSERIAEAVVNQLKPKQLRLGFLSHVDRQTALREVGDAARQAVRPGASFQFFKHLLDPSRQDFSGRDPGVVQMYRDMHEVLFQSKDETSPTQPVS